VAAEVILGRAAGGKCSGRAAANVWTSAKNIHPSESINTGLPFHQMPTTGPQLRQYHLYSACLAHSFQKTQKTLNYRDNPQLNAVL
jgi:hypothetical protein